MTERGRPVGEGRGRFDGALYSTAMFGFFRPAPFIDPLPAPDVDREHRSQRRKVFAGIFIGYAAYYLVRQNFALAIPDILREHPEHTKAQLGTAMTGLALAYGLSKFLMGAVSDRSNPRYFMTVGLLLSCALMAVSGLVKGIYASLGLVILIQTLNGWVQGMGWPPCGKTMVHWFGTRERGRVVAFWNVAHNVGGGLVAKFALAGVLLFGDWGAKFYFNALIASLIALVIFFLLKDTPQSCGLPPIEEHQNDYRPDYSADHERIFTFREIFFQHVFNNKFLWAIAVANAFAYFVRYGVVNWIPTYWRRRRASPSGNRAWRGRSTSSRRSPAPSRAAGSPTRCSAAGVRPPRSSSWRRRSWRWSCAG